MDSAISNLQLSWPTTVVDWYGLSLGGLLLSRFLFHFVRKMLSKVLSVITVFVLRYLIYPSLRKRGFWRHWSRMDFILLGLYFGVNILCLAFRTRSWEDPGTRVGNMLIMNLIPLLTGTRFSLSADLLDLMLPAQGMTHQSIEVASITQVFLHTGIVLIPATPGHGYWTAIAVSRNPTDRGQDRKSPRDVRKPSPSPGLRGMYRYDPSDWPSSCAHGRVAETRVTNRCGYCYKRRDYYNFANRGQISSCGVISVAVDKSIANDDTSSALVLQTTKIHLS